LLLKCSNGDSIFKFKFVTRFVEFGRDEPEGVSDETVDDEVDGGVEDHEEVREEDQDLHLVGRPPGVRPTPHDLVHVGELVDVEDDSVMEFSVQIE
jgi:hypothetical protein